MTESLVFNRLVAGNWKKTATTGTFEKGPDAMQVDADADIISLRKNIGKCVPS